MNGLGIPDLHVNESHFLTRLQLQHLFRPLKDLPCLFHSLLHCQPFRQPSPGLSVDHIGNNLSEVVEGHSNEVAPGHIPLLVQAHKSSLRDNEGNNRGGGDDDADGVHDNHRANPNLQERLKTIPLQVEQKSLI
jgi:hypothetical protein